MILILICFNRSHEEDVFINILFKFKVSDNKMITKILAILIVFSILSNGHGAKILGVFPTMAKS
jgi:hypothetical protein